MHFKSRKSLIKTILNINKKKLDLQTFSTVCHNLEFVLKYRKKNTFFRKNNWIGYQINLVMLMEQSLIQMWYNHFSFKGHGGLEVIPTVTEQEPRYRPGRSPVYDRADIWKQTTIYTYEQFRFIHVFGLWEQARIPGQNPHRHGENKSQGAFTLIQTEIMNYCEMVLWSPGCES